MLEEEKMRMIDIKKGSGQSRIIHMSSKGIILTGFLLATSLLIIHRLKLCWRYSNISFERFLHENKKRQYNIFSRLDSNQEINYLLKSPNYLLGITWVELKPIAFR